MHPGALSTLALEERTTTLESTVPSSLAETVTSLDEKRALAEGQKGLEPSAGCWGLVFGVFQPWFRAHLLKAGMSDALLVLLPAIQVTAYMMTCTLSDFKADQL
ncbi:hypothetical protein FRB97_006769 [Tulasnella sp. 331]|nr:hypothetical protein FRB97_006769 [Tulasnella sp. 331]